VQICSTPVCSSCAGCRSHGDDVGKELTDARRSIAGGVRPLTSPTDVHSARLSRALCFLNKSGERWLIVVNYCVWMLSDRVMRADIYNDSLTHMVPSLRKKKREKLAGQRLEGKAFRPIGHDRSNRPPGQQMQMGKRCRGPTSLQRGSPLWTRGRGQCPVPPCGHCIET